MAVPEPCHQPRQGDAPRTGLQPCLPASLPAARAGSAARSARCRPGPGAACPVSLAMSRVVRRSSLLPAAPRAGQPPACLRAACLRRPPRGSRPWPDPARRGCRAKRPPSPPPSAPWSTTPSSGEGPGDRHPPTMPKRPPSPAPLPAPSWFPRLPGGDRAMRGAPGDAGSPGLLVGQAGLVYTPGHPAVLLQSSLPTSARQREPRASRVHPLGDGRCHSGGGKVPGCTQSPSVRRRRASRARHCVRLNPTPGLLLLLGVGVRQPPGSPWAAFCAQLLSHTGFAGAFL